MKKILLLLTLLLLPLVAAQPPFEQPALIDGFEIIFPQVRILEQNANQTFNFHVVNKSNGIIVSGTLISCRYELFDKNGEHLIQVNIPFDSVNDYEIEVAAGNFSEIGLLDYLVLCNDTTLGGSVEVGLLINVEGKELSESNGKIYFISFALLVFLFLLSLIGGLLIKWENMSDEAGKIIQVNTLRYFKPLLLAMAYMFLLVIVNLAYELTQSYLILLGMAAMFKALYFILFSGAFILLPVVIIITVVVLFRDRQIQRLIDAGFLPVKT